MHILSLVFASSKRCIWYGVAMEKENVFYDSWSTSKANTDLQSDFLNSEPSLSIRSPIAPILSAVTLDLGYQI